ncbi:(2Fe-2S)-binding protein [Streptomyces sp. ST2-7A]|uniref:(2Fe-2S)-binding protein n=1 Tax=Streptomyces sp. ST2-7A TaxID=2907214 RepID=UPI0027E22E40|nr:(2Fe-2S)-binding protein [Streptomyces sp. ST2-7A]
MTGTDPRRRRLRFPRRSAGAPPPAGPTRPGRTVPHAGTSDDPDPGTLLDRVAALGPHFTLHHGPTPQPEPFPPVGPAPDPAPEATDPAGSRPLVELRGPLLLATAADIGRRVGTTDTRVGASTLHLGLAARLWSSALGCAVLAGRVPDLAPDRLWWCLPADGPLRLRLVGPRYASDPPGPADPDPLAAAVHRTVRSALDPLAGELRVEPGLSPRIVLGNTASALVGTARVLRATVPEYADLITSLTLRLLARSPLDAAGRVLPGPDGDPAGGYLRRSCCLYYRVPGGGTCGDCVLNTRARRTRPGGDREPT